MDREGTEKQLQPGVNGAVGRLCVCVCVCVIYKALLAFANYLYGSSQNQLGEHRVFICLVFIFLFNFLYPINMLQRGYIELLEMQITAEGRPSRIDKEHICILLYRKTSRVT